MKPPPMAAQAAYREGFALLGQGRNAEAAAQFEKATSLSPTSAEAHHFWGVALQRIGKVQRAADCFRRAISLNPGAALSQVELGNLMLSLGDPETAVACLRTAVNLQPDSAKGHLLLARALAESQQLDAAETSVSTALRLDPHLHQAQILRGRLQQQQGRFEEAEQTLNYAISLCPNSGDGYYALVNGKRITEADRSLITEIETLLADGRIGPEELRLLRYALGKAYDDLGDYGAAMTHYQEANRLSQARLVSLGRVFDRDRLERRVDDLSARVDDQFLRAHRGFGATSSKPIFIVGMARSGTTLLEQIVSSHPRVAAAGELGSWPEIEALARSANPNSDQVQAIGRKFLGRLDRRLPNAAHVTVKTPQNYMSLGQILAVFPECRILHCRRSPIDTCLSIYTTCFFSGPDFAHELGSLTTAYRAYLRMMDHWRRVLPPDRLMDVSYEDLVADRETVLRRVAEFLGLEWDESLLHHEKNDHPIATPSLWQARQPVFSRSVERWRRYEPWLGPLKELL